MSQRRRRGLPHAVLALCRALVCSRSAGVLVQHAATRDARRTEFRAVVRTVSVHATTCAAPTGSRLTYSKGACWRGSLLVNLAFAGVEG